MRTMKMNAPMEHKANMACAGILEVFNKANIRDISVEIEVLETVLKGHYEMRDIINKIDSGQPA